MLRHVVAGRTVLFLRSQSWRHGTDLGFSGAEQLSEETSSRTRSAYGRSGSIRWPIPDKRERTQTLRNFVEPQNRSGQLQPEGPAICGSSRRYPRDRREFFARWQPDRLLHIGRKSLADERGWKRAAPPKCTSDSCHESRLVSLRQANCFRKTLRVKLSKQNLSC